MAVDFVCPLCHQPVSPGAPNAMKSAATTEWQHKDCWRPTAAPSTPPEKERPSTPRI